MQHQPGFIEDKQFKWEQVGEGVRRKVMAYENSLMLVKVDFDQDNTKRSISIISNCVK